MTSANLAYTVGRAEVDGEHAGNDDALVDALGTAVARRIWWFYTGGGREEREREP